MIIRILKAIAAGKSLVLVKIEAHEKKQSHEIVDIYQQRGISFMPPNAIDDPSRYTICRKGGDIYQPIVLDGRMVKVLVLRKERQKIIWKEVSIPIDMPFTNCCLLGLKAS